MDPKSVISEHFHSAGGSPPHRLELSRSGCIPKVQMDACLPPCVPKYSPSVSSETQNELTAFGGPLRPSVPWPHLTPLPHFPWLLKCHLPQAIRRFPPSASPSASPQPLRSAAGGEPQVYHRASCWDTGPLPGMQTMTLWEKVPLPAVRGCPLSITGAARAGAASCPAAHRTGRGLNK